MKASPSRRAAIDQKLSLAKGSQNRTLICSDLALRNIICSGYRITFDRAELQALSERQQIAIWMKDQEI